MIYPKDVEKLISAFNQLTGLGRKISEKMALSFLNKKNKEKYQFIQNCTNAMESINQCPDCNNFTSNKGLCDICKNPNRDDKLLCIVSYPDYLAAIEKANFYNGKYFILFNEIANYRNNDELDISHLLKFISKKTEIEEIILATNPTIEGILMAKYLEEKISKIYKGKITNLAIGIPMGSKIIYMDGVTLENAFKNRR